jgi:L-ascorbate metabolism protein UlaG (beta-lactamase superfamily)
MQRSHFFIISLTLVFISSMVFICFCQKPQENLQIIGDMQLTKRKLMDHPIQPIIKNNRFFNNEAESKIKHMGDALQIFIATKTSTSKYFSGDYFDWVRRDTVLNKSIDLQAQWIGHASFLIQANNFNILSDPLFFHLQTPLYPRKTPVGIRPEKLPRIDFVIISHNHRDHLDEQSMKLLVEQQPIMLVPQGTKEWFIDRGFSNVFENNWWETSSFSRDGKDIEFTFVPAVHWSGRGLTDAHTSLWGGWVIKTANRTVYFAGDTGLNKNIFNAIKEFTKKIDCVFLPIGPCEPRKLMQHSHMSAEEAVEAYKILEASLFIPMHWGTFALGPDSFDAPMQRLDQAWAENIPVDLQKNLYRIKFGERINIENLVKPDPAPVAASTNVPSISEQQNSLQTLNDSR